MSKIIFGILLALALVAVVLSVGALINLPNPKIILAFAIGFAIVLTIGYILGKKAASGYYYAEPEQVEVQE